MNSILYFLGAQLIRLLHATLRVRHVRVEKIERIPQYIIAFWHAHLLLMLHARYRKLLGRGKCPQHVVTAVGRELLGFIWAIGVTVEREQRKTSSSIAA